MRSPPSGGITLGYLISRSQYSIRVFEPLFAGIYSVPIILFLPLYVLFFGLGPASKIALGATISFFPIVLNTIAGFGYVDRIFVTAARSMGASDYQMFRHVLLPAALPVILTGMRIGFTVALLSILGSETIASLAGLGHRIVHLAEGMETARMFAYIVFVVVIAVILNTVRVVARSAGEAPMSEAPRIRRVRRALLRRPWVARARRSSHSCSASGRSPARWCVDPIFLSPPSRGVRRRSTRCSRPAACRRRCGSRSGSSRSPSRFRS